MELAKLFRRIVSLRANKPKLKIPPKATDGIGVSVELAARAVSVFTYCK
jgi:hypothetical protein